MGKYICKVCDDKVARVAVDEHLAEGMSGAAIARLMTLRGWSVTPETINQHKPHNAQVAPAGIVKRKKDLATLTRDRVHSIVENAEDDDLLGKAMQGAIKVGLQAEKVIDTREARTDDKKLAVVFATILAGGQPGVAGFLAPGDLVGEDDIIEGEAVEVE